MKTANILKGAAAGIIGGFAASYVMSRAQQTVKEYQEYLQKNVSFMKKDENEESSNPGEEPATVKAAEAISSGILHKEIKDEDKPTAGEAVHYSFGSLTGGIYGILSEIKPAVTRGAGLPFGAALWMSADNIGVPLFRLSKSPLKYPVSTHVYALGSHLVYGATTEIIRRLLRKII